MGLTRCQNWALFCSFYNLPSFYMIFLPKLSNQKYNWSTIIQNPGFANERNRTTLMRNSLKKKTRNCIRVFQLYQSLMSKKYLRALARNLRCPRCWSPIWDVGDRFFALNNGVTNILKMASFWSHQHHCGHISRKCFWVFSWNRPREDLLSVRSKLKLVGIIQMNPNETSKLILFMALIDKGWRIGFWRYLDVCKSYISIKVI